MTTQHRLMVLDVKLKSRVKKKTTCKQSRIRWWALKGANQLAFQEKLRDKGAWDLRGRRTS